ncbi:MAG: IS91 family transposase [Planctomycetota bacterium]|nr:IS91 family transposase [Planctomycetota bacterium]
MPHAHARAAGEEQKRRPRFEVADIFRRYGPAYRAGRSLPLSHLKVMRAIETCRTAALGGHVDRCLSCGFERIAYNSCRNRHCPKCQALAKAEWLERRKAELLPTTYFHTVFTLPHEINGVAQANKRVVFDILFKSVAETLQEFAGDPRHGLGGKIGFTAVLHTWDQQLKQHVHLHCLIPAGVLSFDGRRWIAARRTFLFPVKAMGKMFRGKFIAYLKNAFKGNKLIFPGKLASFHTLGRFAGLVSQLWRKDWIVYSQPPFSGPEKTLDYLGRYTHRIAISNNRILSGADGAVTFWYRDRRDHDKRKRMTLAADEFIRRFLLHTLPKSYRRIRHFGVLANRKKGADLARCRALLGAQPAARPPKMSAPERLLLLTGIDLKQCPHCKSGAMVRIAQIDSHAWSAVDHQPPARDSS